MNVPTEYERRNACIPGSVPKDIMQTWKILYFLPSKTWMLGWGFGLAWGHQCKRPHSLSEFLGLVLRSGPGCSFLLTRTLAGSADSSKSWVLATHMGCGMHSCFQLCCLVFLRPGNIWRGNEWIKTHCMSLKEIHWRECFNQLAIHLMTSFWKTRSNVRT